jgi:hypothetical protein
MPSSVGTPLAAWKASRRGSILQRGRQVGRKVAREARLVGSPLIVSTAEMQTHCPALCGAASMCIADAATLLQSVAMSVMRRTARTGSNEPQVQRTGSQ